MHVMFKKTMFGGLVPFIKGMRLDHVVAMQLLGMQEGRKEDAARKRTRPISEAVMVPGHMPHR